jgi:hypothetical protein
MWKHGIRAVFVAVAMASWLAAFGSDEADREMTREEFVEHLLARQETLSEGTVRFSHYVLRVQSDYFKSLKAEVTDKRSSLQDLRQFLGNAERANSTDLIGAFTGAYFYRGDKWRLALGRSDEFGSPEERLRALAKPGVRIVPQVKTEDIAYNGEYITHLQDNNKLILRPFEEGKYFSLWKIDFSFYPWQSMLDAPLQQGQRQSFVVTDGSVQFTDTFPSGVTTTVFSSVHGYGPVFMKAVVSDGKTVQDQICRLVSDQHRLPTVEVSLNGRYEKDGSVKVDFWLVSQWSPDVSDSDLAVSLPPDYVEIDERFGVGVPKIVGEAVSLEPGVGLSRWFWIGLNVLVIVAVLAWMVRFRLARSVQ